MFRTLCLIGLALGLSNNVSASVMISHGVGIASIDTTKLKDGSVTNPKIADGAVDTAKIATDAVTTVKIINSAVDTTKLGDAAVTTIKVANSAIDTGKLATDSVTTVKIIAGAVDTTKLSAYALIDTTKQAAFSQLGIGTASPCSTCTLHVAGKISATGMAVDNDAVGADFTVNTSTFVVQDGQVGIGGVGSRRFTLAGTNASLYGPHMEFYSLGNSQPTLSINPWAHDDVAIRFDAYYDGAHKSGSANGNFQMSKQSGVLQIDYANGVAAGGAVTWSAAPALAIKSATGNVGIGTASPQSTLDVNGQTTIRGAETVVGSGTFTAGIGMGANSAGANSKATNLSVWDNGTSASYGVGLTHYGTPYGVGIHAGSATDAIPQMVVEDSNGSTMFYPQTLYTSTITAAGNASFAGTVSAAAQPFAIVSTGAFNLLNNTYTTLGWDAVVSSAAGTFAALDGQQLVAPVAGKYLWGCTTQFIGHATGSRQVLVRVSGNSKTRGRVDVGGSAGDTVQDVTAGGLEYLLAGQYLTCMVMQNSGAEMLTGASSFWMQMVP